MIPLWSSAKSLSGKGFLPIGLTVVAPAIAPIASATVGAVASKQFTITINAVPTLGALSNSTANYRSPEFSLNRIVVVMIFTTSSKSVDEKCGRPGAANGSRDAPGLAPAVGRPDPIGSGPIPWFDECASAIAS